MRAWLVCAQKLWIKLLISFGKRPVRARIRPSATNWLKNDLSGNCFYYQYFMFFVLYAFDERLT